MRIPGGWREDVDETKVSGRRRFLLGAAAAGGALIGAGAARAGDAAPPADPEWSQTLGPGVVDRPYGNPSQFVKDVIRRNVPWLTAGTESSVSFTPLQDQPGIITAWKTPVQPPTSLTGNRSAIAAGPLTGAGLFWTPGPANLRRLVGWLKPGSRRLTRTTPRRCLRADRPKRRTSSAKAPRGPFPRKPRSIRLLPGSRLSGRLRGAGFERREVLQTP